MPASLSAYGWRQADILEADLILGHAGAGTIVEALRAPKKIVVVLGEGAGLSVNSKVILKYYGDRRCQK